jgi:hypothetical protein
VIRCVLGTKAGEKGRQGSSLAMARAVTAVQNAFGQNLIYQPEDTATKTCPNGRPNGVLGDETVLSLGKDGPKIGIFSLGD